MIPQNRRNWGALSLFYYARYLLFLTISEIRGCVFDIPPFRHCYYYSAANLGALLSGLYHERRYINLEIQYEMVRHEWLLALRLNGAGESKHRSVFSRILGGGGGGDSSRGIKCIDTRRRNKMAVKQVTILLYYLNSSPPYYLHVDLFTTSFRYAMHWARKSWIQCRCSDNMDQCLICHDYGSLEGIWLD